ncbi:hypothetical protein CONPUDRAFT_153805 [Coniophora puteana RWD-64-598 SS2]|uniref:Uncharacterized protein n=1 Tax=Coniophora puteana (strain RWD-64-598) TaxID=741705 RepID=A0A5M3MR94_CONPW|nr:uncharacterized protein CONPUDRAFT_153805 [Coniophora puteana RWD-64-598 SS2]EIW81254.1 hypothetical protein CONPUDRAFT_153805 [Coniophora puteana RWD-64-598 SS2]
MSHVQTDQRHSLEGKNLSTRQTDYTDPSSQSNQGIRDGRPEGRQPESAPIQVDTYVDNDAAAPQPPVTASSTLTGANSAEVSETIGKPGQGMSSKELRHDGQPGRKRHAEGVDQFGTHALPSEESGVQ